MKLPRKVQLTGRRKRLLKATIIDESEPGTVLHDFEAFLSFLQERDVRATGMHQLPLRVLPEINTRMACPLHIDLQRPQQKSYPHINGLYLLLRASGLVRIGGTAKKPMIVVDEDVYQSWQTLNPTERYMTLFETWLLRTRGEMINEENEGFWFVATRVFEEWAWFFNKLPRKGQSVGDDIEAMRSLRYYPGLHHLALMELFGLVSIEHGPPDPGKGWRIERVKRTPLGEALLALLSNEFFNDLSNFEQFESVAQTPFGVLQPCLQPYFPAWVNNLSIPEWVLRRGTHVFKVSLGSIWRRIAIPGNYPIDVLASAIVDSVNFTHDHLYDFRYENRFGVVERIDHPDLDTDWAGPRTTKVLVGEVPLQIGQAMTFTYDYGDCWEFEVILESVDPDVTTGYVKLLERHGRAPRQYR